MSFKDWIFSSYPNPSISGQWGLMHILTLVFCVAVIVSVTLIFRNKSEKAKRIVLWVLAALILVFELTRRIVNLIKNTNWDATSVLYILLPRPWCAISCWATMISVLVNKKFFYNFASATSLICAIIFFAYPSVGFNNEYILFENLYSIATHSLILITSILLITLKFTKFEYKNIWKEAICLAVILVYVFLEIYVLKIEGDPMYFMPNNDVMDILSISYGAYLPIYILFMLVYFNIFYLIDDRKSVKSIFVRKKKVKILTQNEKDVENEPEKKDAFNENETEQNNLKQ